MQQSVTRSSSTNSREIPQLIAITLSQIEQRDILQLLDRLSQLSGLTSAERDLVAHWRAVRRIPSHQLSSFRFMCRKHLREAA